MHDDFDDNDFISEHDEFQDESDLLPCPQCGAMIYEDSEACPICGSYVTFRNSPFANRSLVWIVLGLLGVVALTWALLFSGPAGL